MFYDRGSVVILRMRWPDGSGSKPRPAVVLSTDAYHQDRVDMVIVGLTSNLVDHRHGDYTLADWHEAGLLGPTKSKAVIATVMRTAVRKELGLLSPKDLEQVESSIRLVLKL